MAINKCKIVFVILAAIFAHSCEKTIVVEEYGSITGVVVDAQSNEPIQGVAISTSPASNNVITSADGSFTLINVPMGEVTLTAKKLEYKSNNISLKVFADETSETTVVLEKLEGYDQPSGNIYNPHPLDRSVDQSVQDTLKWQIILDRVVDSIKFKVSLYESNIGNPIYESPYLKDSFAIINPLEYNTTYYWQVAAFDKDSLIANSEIWSFTTQNNPVTPILFAQSINSNYDIYSTDTAGSVLFQITNEASNIDWHPRANVITKRIAFVSNRQFNPQIYTMNEHGDDVRRVTSLPITGNYNSGTGFCWSPDGSQLLYPHYDKLYQINADGTGLKQIATAPTGRQYVACDWSKYTGKIVVQTMGNNPFDNELYIMNEDGSDIALFVDNLPGVIQNPVFSVDGLRIMYTRDMDGLDSWDGRQLNAHILIHSVSDTTITDISVEKPAGTNDLMPRFSPDGSKVVFVNVNNVAGSINHIMITNVDGTYREMIFEGGTTPEWR